MKLNKKIKILLVEDEIDILNLMKLHLERNGYNVTSITNAEEALEKINTQHFDIGIFDWMLPQMSGLELCKIVHNKMPILIVTAKSTPTDIIEALNTGADDFITKPFDIAIFLSRVKALLRRTRFIKETSNNENCLQLGPIKIDLNAHKTYCNEHNIYLTVTEFKMLVALVQNAGKALTRDLLIDLVQGENVSVTSRTIDTHMVSLRKKLGNYANMIETIRGIGYRLNFTE